MKIVSIETFTNEYVGLVRLRTDEGDEGWGQTSTYNSEITAQVLHLQVAPHVLGMSGHDISEVNREVLEREHKFPGTYLYRALCGVDTALWDIKGKRAKKKVSVNLLVVALFQFQSMPLVCSVRFPLKLRLRGFLS